MKQLFLITMLLAMGLNNLYADEYRWTKIKDKGEFKHEKLGFSSTGYDRVHNLIYSMKYVDDTLIVMAYDIRQHVFIEIPNQGAPNELRTFTYDYTNDRLIAVRSGRENLYALPSSGGEWTQIATGSFDNESYNAGYFWNDKTQSMGFVGGYGLYNLNNWVWNKYPDQPMKSNPVYEWSTGQKEPFITVPPAKTSTYYLTTTFGATIYVDSITVHVSESNVDIFGYSKVHEKQVNHSYYTAYHEGSSYNWEISGNAVLASNNGGSSILVSFTKPGLAYLKVTETNKEGCIADTMLTITVHSLTSVEEGTMGAHVNIFPNPVNQEDAITVRTMLSPNGQGFVELLDMMGKQLFQTSTHAGDSYEQFTTNIPVASLSNGMYLIRIHDGSRSYVEKLLINR